MARTRRCAIVGTGTRNARAISSVSRPQSVSILEAENLDQTDWPRIVQLYDLLLAVGPSPVVALNRAVAVAMARGPAAGLALVDDLTKDGSLDDYHLLHAARADLLRRLGSEEAAAQSYRRALALVGNASERRFLERRLRELTGPPS